jgi:hypothetical protein
MLEDYQEKHGKHQHLEKVSDSQNGQNNLRKRAIPMIMVSWLNQFFGLATLDVVPPSLALTFMQTLEQYCG